MTDEYIRKEDAVEALDGKIVVTGHENADAVLQYMKDITNKIKSLEPADVVQVKHGKWKKIGAWGRVYRCNQCGNFLDFDGVNAGRGDANFCPNCGAKMDGGENG